MLFLSLVISKNKNMSSITNRLSITISVIAIFSVFLHDTKIDNATAVIMKIPEVIAEYNLNRTSLNYTNQHPHFEVNSFTTQPRDENNKKYIAQRRLLANNLGGAYIWPST